MRRAALALSTAALALLGYAAVPAVPAEAAPPPPPSLFVRAELAALTVATPHAMTGVAVRIYPAELA
ncbi:hypothetical protein [Peterkaempfera bronchialis]|uniref:hypothetical protein n=1 Tax=Peterkaempfera bronchialis TaxID=2126346 RepID=UPI003C2D5EFB